MGGFSYRALGKTGLNVYPIGIGGGSAIESDDVLYAFERGINYFFFSSDLHHFTYRNMAAGLRKLCKAGSSTRQQVVLATVSYINNPEKLPAIMIDIFRELRIDYIDVFHWGWVTEKDDCAGMFQAATMLKENGEQVADFREQVLRAAEVNNELVSRGLVRYVGASFHSRQLARQWMNNLDVTMLRYNLAHLGVETGIFPLLTGDKTKDPGIVAFNVGHEGQKFISDPPAGYPTDKYVPTTPECYRFALSNPWVDLVLAGLGNREQIDAAMSAMEQGPLSIEECDYFREYGWKWREVNTRPGPNLLSLLGLKV